MRKKFLKHVTVYNIQTKVDKILLQGKVL